MSYLIIGATGNVGGALATQLLDQGRTVRALVRSADRAQALPAGVDFVVGDLDDETSLAAASDGVEGVFYMQVAPIPVQAQKMANAAAAAGVRKLVVLSSIGTVLEPLPMIGAAIATRDAVFRSADLDVTYLLANTLMTNAFWWLPSIREEGKVYDASDPGRTVPVDAADVARVAALALTQEGHAGKRYILNGPEALTAREQVEILSDELARAIEFVPVTPESFAARAIEAGDTAQHARAVQNLNELFRAGRAGVVAPDLLNLTGSAGKTFRQWCVDNADAFA